MYDAGESMQHIRRVALRSAGIAFSRILLHACNLLHNDVKQLKTGHVMFECRADRHLHGITHTQSQVNGAESTVLCQASHRPFADDTVDICDRERLERAEQSPVIAARIHRRRCSRQSTSVLRRHRRPCRFHVAPQLIGRSQLGVADFRSAARRRLRLTRRVRRLPRCRAGRLHGLPAAGAATARRLQPCR